jgi:hypothetical protein
MHVVEAHGMSQVLDLLREAVGETGEPPHPHAHGQVLTFDIGVLILSGSGLPMMIRPSTPATTAGE